MEIAICNSPLHRHALFQLLLDCHNLAMPPGTAGTV